MFGQSSLGVEEVHAPGAARARVLRQGEEEATCQWRVVVEGCVSCREGYICKLKNIILCNKLYIIL